jgi:hypothetical protein
MHPLCHNEFWSRSWVTVPSAKFKMHEIRAKSLLEMQKGRIFEIFILNAKFLEVSQQNLLVAELPMKR